MTPAQITSLQSRLTAGGYNAGPADGALGAKTYRALFNYAAKRDCGDKATALGAAAVQDFITYAINTPYRLAHFLAQASHETGGFRYDHEIWGPTPAQRGYERREDLGNKQPGDGYLYRGRGIFQLTGRANYADYGHRLNLPLEANPDLAAEPVTSLLIACDYWQRRNINPLADADDVKAVTRKINGGTNGLADRMALLDRLKAVLL